ncbi:hypothetical protein FOZ61_002814 [Perkinsus olseni]|uniref:Transmembrane and coiled-coil domain-containing protein 4 n=1 Tax=Perkinsus olseni TaxID=32597 RepID=A0A7J6LRT1_PEROL|nr:hypothetical protein FOZ61_002814 [Perkinsus olseni]
MSRGAGNVYDSRMEEPSGSNPGAVAFNAHLIDFDSVGEADAKKEEDPPDSEPSSAGSAKKKKKLSKHGKATEEQKSLLLDESEEASSTAIVPAAASVENTSAHKMAVKAARERYHDLRANRVDAIKEARATNDRTTFEGTKMLRELPSDMRMSLGGIWVCVVSVLARRWLTDWKECKGSDGDDDDDVGDDTSKNAASSSPTPMWGRHKYRGSKLGKAVVTWARRSLEVVLDIIDADEACCRALTQLLEMNLPGGLQWRTPPPEADGFVAHLMTLEGGKSSVSLVLRDLTLNLLGGGPGESTGDEVNHERRKKKRSGKKKSKEGGAKQHIYNSRTRCALFEMAGLFGISAHVIEGWECEVGLELNEALRKGKEEEEEQQHQRQLENRVQPGVDHVRASSGSRLSRRMKIGAAALGGGALLALTGGLAAPAVVAGLASVGTALGSLGSLGVAVGGLIVSASGFLAAVGTAGVAVLFGAGGAGLTGFKMNRRWGDLHEFEFKDAYAESAILKSKGRAFDSWGRKVDQTDSATNDRGQASDPGALELRLCVGGWLRDRDDVILPWIEPEIYSEDTTGSGSLNRCGGHPARQSEVYAVNWESHDLLRLGSVLRRLITDEIAKQAASLWLQATIGAAAATAMFPVWIIKYMTDLDNTWLVVRDRSSVAGEVLASAIMDPNCVGNRPVTLVGISNGARVIFKCLEILARAVVSGRFVNGYSGSDWVLGFLYRYMEWGVKVAGLSPARGISGVENVDLGKLVERHDHYPEYLSEIMAVLDILE